MKITHFIIKGGSALIRVLSFLLSLFLVFSPTRCLKIFHLFKVIVTSSFHKEMF